MSKAPAPLLSVVVPLYNEAAGLPGFHESLLSVVRAATKGSYEIIYCDDGSDDGTADIIKRLHADDPEVKLVRLSRNFGKESVLTAGIAAASGEAVLTIDGDGQHPVGRIPDFIKAWRQGAQVVVGVRVNYAGDGFLNSLGSWLFYRLFNLFTGHKLLPGSTDFRLIDKSVAKAFLSLKEGDRITRGLIDWLGFKREIISFQAGRRQAGSAAYSRGQLIQLAANSFVSFSPKPLYLFGYLGMAITFFSLLLGTTVIIEQLVLGDPWQWDFTGTAMLGILTLFLVGIILLSQGILSLYISHIHSQAKGRPLYVIDYSQSVGLEQPAREN